MRTIEYKKLKVRKLKKTSLKGSNISVLNLHNHAKKYLKKMDLDDPFNKKIVQMYLEYLSKCEKLNYRDKIWLVEYVAITESIENDVNFNIVNRIPIKLTPNHTLYIGPGIDFIKDNNELGQNIKEDNLNKKIAEDKIGINLNYIKKLEENDNFYNILLTCYHEINHSIQNKVMTKTKYPNFEALMLSFEQILITYDTNYYDCNYERMFIENQAEMSAVEKALKLLKKCNIDKYNTIYEEQEKKINKCKNNSKIFITNKDVIYNLGEVTSTKIVDEIVEKKPELLKEFPCLKYVYDTEGNVKDVQRLIDDEKTCIELYKKIYSKEEQKIIDTKELYNHILWVRLLDEKEYEKYTKEEIDRIEECLLSMKENLKEREEANNSLEEKELYDIKKNELIINKNYVICDELLKNINYSNMFSNKLK